MRMQRSPVGLPLVSLRPTPIAWTLLPAAATAAAITSAGRRCTTPPARPSLSSFAPSCRFSANRSLLAMASLLHRLGGDRDLGEARLGVGRRLLGLRRRGGARRGRGPAREERDAHLVLLPEAGLLQALHDRRDVEVLPRALGLRVAVVRLER